MAHIRHGSRRASDRSRLASTSPGNSFVTVSNLTGLPRKIAMLAAWQAMCALHAASALPFGRPRVFTQSRNSRTWKVAG